MSSQYNTLGTPGADAITTQAVNMGKILGWRFDARVVKAVTKDGIHYALGHNGKDYFYLDSGLICDEFGSLKQEQVLFATDDKFINNLAN